MWDIQKVLASKGKKKKETKNQELQSGTLEVEPEKGTFLGFFLLVIGGECIGMLWEVMDRMYSLVIFSLEIRCRNIRMFSYMNLGESHVTGSY